jgi:medium-chain acyl-[acyl-carrier-protein] hydrolase
VLRTLRADFTLTEAYRYRATCSLGCPITAFGGMDDRLVIREQLEAWAGETTNRFRLHLLPGGHFFHQEPQAREELLSLMREYSEV